MLKQLLGKLKIKFSSTHLIVVHVDEARVHKEVRIRPRTVTNEYLFPFLEVPQRIALAAIRRRVEVRRDLQIGDKNALIVRALARLIIPCKMRLTLPFSWLHISHIGIKAWIMREPSGLGTRFCLVITVETAQLKNSLTLLVTSYTAGELFGFFVLCPIGDKSRSVTRQQICLTFFSASRCENY